MKKSVLLTIIMVLNLATISAQEFNIGAKAGLNLATLGGDFNNGKTRTSFHLGGMVEIPVLDAFSVQPELLYSSQGAKSTEFDEDVVKFDYLNIPIMAKYYVTEEISIEAGPQVGILLSAKTDIDGETDDIKDITKSTDFGFNLGLGYKMESGINFAARYYFGFNINDIPNDTDKITNGVFQISVGYFFN